MKRWVPRLLTIFCFTLVAASVAVPASAQLGERLTFQTTFPFTAGNATFPAGRYEVRPVSDDGGYVEIISVGSDHATYVEVASANKQAPATEPDFVFKKYGNKYLLKSIYAPDGTGVTTASTKAESQHAKTGTPTDQRVKGAKAKS